MFDRFLSAILFGVFSVFGSALMVWGCETLPGDPPPGARQQPGFGAYTTYCARCHGQDGASDRSTRIAKRPVSLIDPAWRDTVDVDEIEHIILNGSGKMKGLAEDLDSTEAASVARYVWWMPVSETGP